VEDANPPRPAPARTLADRARSWITWFGAARLIAVSVSVVLVAAAAFWLLRSPRPSTESQLPYAAGAAGVATTRDAATTLPPSVVSTTAVATDVVVHVAGAVTSPGVYHLPAGARVVDAITAAGGMRTDANADGVNLAAVARDGSRVYVPVVGEAMPVVVDNGAPAVGSTLPAGPIDLNAATAQELDQLPGVGPATAAAIVAYRDAHGPFATVADLADVRGIGPAKLDALRGLVTT
ncbi:MAG: helix-hairpin-helix domain-containing protein, partial [Ilumatobacteraceae bacterium]